MRVIPGGQLYVSTGPPPGPDVWYYSSGFSESSGGDGSENWQTNNYYKCDTVPIAQAGTITSIGIRAFSSGGTINLQIGVWDAAGTLLGWGTGSTSSGGYTWVDATVSVPIGVESVRVGSLSDSANAHYRRTTNGNTGVFVSGTFGQAPPNLDSPNSSSNTWGVRAYVD